MRLDARSISLQGRERWDGERWDEGERGGRRAGRQESGEEGETGRKERWEREPGGGAGGEEGDIYQAIQCRGQSHRVPSAQQGNAPHVHEFSFAKIAKDPSSSTGNRQAVSVSLQRGNTWIDSSFKNNDRKFHWHRETVVSWWDITYHLILEPSLRSRWFGSIYILLLYFDIN